MEDFELQDIIQQGENSSVEFKEHGVKNETLVKEMLAFANSQGGVIILGVTDSGIITGIPSDSRLEERIMNIARDSIIPPLEPEFQLYTFEDKTLGIITIPKGKDKPYQAAGIFHYDANVVEKTDIRDFNFTELDQYFSEYHIDFSKQSETDKQRLLINTDLLSEDGQATVGGLLMFGINPERYLPQSGISFASFAGNEIQSELIDKQNVSGPLPFIVDRTLAIIKTSLPVPSDIKGGKRENLRVYPPMKVFRELIVNACVHRNYAIVGSKIRILMFRDRIEFISPGRLPNTVTIEKLKLGVSYSSNPILLKFMDNLGYVERLGRGLPMVYYEIKKLGKEVIFKELGEEFRVIVPIIF